MNTKAHVVAVRGPKLSVPVTSGTAQMQESRHDDSTWFGDEWFVPAASRRSLHMGKLILIAAIALMSTTPSYANLSLASSGAAPPPVAAQPVKQTEDLPVHAAVKSPTVVSPKRKRVAHASKRAFPTPSGSFVPLQSAHCE